LTFILRFSVEKGEEETATAQQGVHAFFISTWAALCLFFWETFNEKRRRSWVLAIRYIFAFSVVPGKGV
jgi:hypothetical protein